jgi:hypothetical protein
MDVLKCEVAGYEGRLCKFTQASFVTFKGHVREANLGNPLKHLSASPTYIIEPFYLSGACAWEGSTKEIV